MQPNKEIIFHEDARNSVIEGIHTVAEAVKVTLGPYGRNVAIEKEYGAPFITNDGVSVARAIKVKDRFENMGVELAKSVASKTEIKAFDGTTTSIILFEAMVKYGTHLMEKYPDINVVQMRKSMIEEAQKISQDLLETSRQINTLEEAENVANTSVENMEIAKMIAKTVFSFGKGSRVVVEETPDKANIEIETRSGYTVDCGFGHTPYPVTNISRMEGDYTDVLVLVTEEKIFTSDKIFPLIKTLAENGIKNLLLVADDIDGEALSTFAVNRANGVFNVLPIRFRVFGDDRRTLLSDLATRAGTEVYGLGKGKALPDVKMTDLGVVGRVIISSDTTSIIGALKGQEGTDALIDKIKENPDEFTKERIANLEGKMAVVKVGGISDTDRKYWKAKLDDAVGALQGAMEEGTVAGGGYALNQYACDPNFDPLVMHTLEGIKVDGAMAGEWVVRRACLVPTEVLIKNSGVTGVTAKPSLGYNSALGINVPEQELYNAGVIDPARVPRTALLNATADASMFLTMEVAIVNKDDEKRD